MMVMAKYNIELLAVIDADSYEQAFWAAEELAAVGTGFARNFNTDGNYGIFTTPVTVEAIGDRRERWTTESKG